MSIASDPTDHPGDRLCRRCVRQTTALGRHGAPAGPRK